MAKGRVIKVPPVLHFTVKEVGSTEKCREKARFQPARKLDMTAWLRLTLSSCLCLHLHICRGGFASQAVQRENHGLGFDVIYSQLRDDCISSAKGAITLWNSLCTPQFSPKGIVPADLRNGAAWRAGRC
jgi:hypothetical protein